MEHAGFLKHFFKRGVRFFGLTLFHPPASSEVLCGEAEPVFVPGPGVQEQPTDQVTLQRLSLAPREVRPGRVGWCQVHSGVATSPFLQGPLGRVLL